MSKIFSISLFLFIMVYLTPTAQAHTMYATIIFNNTAVDENACCKDIKLPAETFEMKGTFNMAKIRGTPKLSLGPQENHTSAYRTVVMMDPEMDNGTAHVYLLMMNIPANNTLPRTTLVDYRFPKVKASMRQNQRIITVRVYRQSGVFNTSEVQTSHCDQHPENGCKVDVNSIVSHFNLTFDSEVNNTGRLDLYSRYRAYQLPGGNKALECKGVAVYDDPCPTGGACFTYLGQAALVVSLIAYFIIWY